MPKTEAQNGMPAHIAGKTQYDLAWVQNHVDVDRITELLSDYLHTVSQPDLQRIVQTNGHPRCYSPIRIFKTYLVRLTAFKADGRHPASRLAVTCQTATEVEADEDSGDPRFGSNSITFDLETTATVTLTVKNGDITDVALKAVEF